MVTDSQLKINATNIRSILITGRKSEQRIASKKISLVRREQQKEARAEKEESLEKVRIPTLGIPSLIGGATAGVRSGLGGFLTNILIGWLINKLPSIVKKVKEVYKKVKPIIDGALKTLGSIFDGTKFLFEKVSTLGNDIKNSGTFKQAEKLFNDVSTGWSRVLTYAGGVVSDIERSLKDSQSEGTQQLPSGGAAGMMGYTGSSSSSSPQSRNSGGEILNTTQPRAQDFRDDMHRMNPIRLFPKVTNKNTRNTRAFRKNIDNFSGLVKLLGLEKSQSASSTSSGTSSGTGRGTASMLGSGGGALSGLSDDDWKYLGFVVSKEAQANSDDEYGVAASVLNRVASKDWPNTIKGVIFQKDQYEAVYKGLAVHDPALVAKLRSAEGQAKIVEALKTLQGRTDFKGTTQYHNYVAGEDIKFSSRGNFYHYSWQTGRNSVKPAGFADVDWMRFVKARNLTPSGRKSSGTTVILQPVEVEKIRYVNRQQQRKGIQGQLRSSTLNSTGNYHDFG